MTFDESSNKLEKSEGQKPNPEAKKLASVQDFDDFYQDTEKRIVAIIGPDETKKRRSHERLITVTSF